MDGKPFSVSISNPLDQLISAMGFELGSSRNVSHIEAPMPGLILDIPVSSFTAKTLEDYPGQVIKSANSEA